MPDFGAMPKTKAEKEHDHQTLLDLFCTDRSAAESYHLLIEQQRNRSPFQSWVYKWHVHFSQGDTNLKTIPAQEPLKL